MFSLVLFIIEVFLWREVVVYSYREAGGTFGKIEAAREEEFIRRLVGYSFRVIQVIKCNKRLFSHGHEVIWTVMYNRLNKVCMGKCFIFIITDICNNLLKHIWNENLYNLTSTFYINFTVCSCYISSQQTCWISCASIWYINEMYNFSPGDFINIVWYMVLGSLITFEQLVVTVCLWVNRRQVNSQA